MVMVMVNQFDLAALAAALGVAALVAARLYYGESAFSPESRWWGPLRRVVIPLAHQILTTIDPAGETGIYLTYEITREELVVSVETNYHAILDDLADAGYRPQPLAALKTDWEGRREVASWARYHGPKPFDAAPDWLRPRQTHVTLFADVAPSVNPTQSGDGEDEVSITIVTAHEEANPWRPDLWRVHYRGLGMNVTRGVLRVSGDLGVSPEVDVTSHRARRKQLIQN